MPIIETSYEHVVLNEEKQLIIKGTRIKLLQLVLDKIAYGWSPEELQFQHPELTLGQVYSGLAYYADHQEELDRQIQNQLKQIEQLRKKIKPPSFAKEIKSKKRM